MNLLKDHVEINESSLPGDSYCSVGSGVVLKKLLVLSRLGRGVLLCCVRGSSGCSGIEKRTLLAKEQEKPSLFAGSVSR